MITLTLKNYKFILLIYIFCFFFLQGCNKEKAKVSTNIESKTVSIDDMFVDFRKNSVAADSKYNNILISSRGRVDGFEKTNRGYTLTVRSHSQNRIFEDDVIVNFGKDLISEELQKSLRTHELNIQYVDFIAKFNNYNGGNIYLEGIRIIRVDTEKELFEKKVEKFDIKNAIEVTPKQLRADDSDKYKDKFIILWGYVHTISDHGPYNKTYDLLFVDKSRENAFSCEFDKNETNKNQIAKLIPFDFGDYNPSHYKPGSYVKLLGVLESSWLQPKVVKCQVLEIK